MSAAELRPTPSAPIPVDTLAAICRDLASRPYARRGIAPAETPIRVMLVDDHAVVRAGIRALLRSFTDISVVAEAANGEDAIAIIGRVRPQVIVMDLDMPRADGAATTRVLRDTMPEARVLILTMYPERERLAALLESGARGYLTKDVADRDLAEAIRVVASGDVYVRPAVARELAACTAPVPATVSDARMGYGRLSKRERSVVGLTAYGFNGPEIGRQLGITAKTVDTYKQRIEQKLGFSHRTDYVRFALDAQLFGAGR